MLVTLNKPSRTADRDTETFYTGRHKEPASNPAFSSVQWMPLPARVRNCLAPFHAVLKGRRNCGGSACLLAAEADNSLSRMAEQSLPWGCV